MKKPNTTLTASDWSEIYYAVEFKRDHSPAAAHDAAWQKQLSRIMEKIGPDGERAAQAQKLQRKALQEIATIAESGVVLRHETGKPTWSATDEIAQISRAAIKKATA